MFERPCSAGPFCIFERINGAGAAIKSSHDSTLCWPRQSRP
ncbi:MAG: peptidase inhibitor family I36 protein [Paucibacter sp.]|nr:peptidase inhibitor family I36 protein [Roseateles sp.]